MSEEILLTQEGYDKIVAEHEELVSVRRKEVSERLKEAISYGDLSENSEYDSAKNEQAELEERILKLENMIAFGDSYNDLSMLNSSGLGIAMGNAQTTVKKQSDYVTDSNNEDGIAKAICRFVYKEAELPRIA